MACTRREFLIALSSAGLGAFGASSQIGCVALRQDDRSKVARTTHHPLGSQDILVVIFLRGGADGLNLLAPVDDRNYIAARGSELRIRDKGDDKGLEIARAYGNQDFRLHRAAGPLKELYDSKNLAFIHASGLTHATRSHFEAQSMMERGISDPRGQGVATGWLTRHIQRSNLSPILPAVALDSVAPESLLGCAHCVSLVNPADFRLQAEEPYGKQMQGLLRKFYGGSTPLDQAVTRTLDAIDVVDTRLKRDEEGNVEEYHPSEGVEYPTDWYATGFSDALKSLVRLIKMDLGVAVATVSYDGWDNHENQPEYFPNLVDGLSRGLQAFYNDVSSYTKDLSIVVMSEFGRRLRANESRGTDHGHGNLMMVLGGRVNGGQCYGRWPGLSNEELDEHVDLAVTTDYRSVLSELLTKRLGYKILDKMFPGYAGPLDLGIFQLS